MNNKPHRFWKIQDDLHNVRYFLQAGYHLYMATLLSKCAQPTTPREAEITAEVTNIFFTDCRVSPGNDMNDVDEIANEALRSYKEYNRYVDLFRGNPRILISFCKWFAVEMKNSTSLNLNYIYIIFLAGALISKRSGAIDENEFKARMKHCMLIGNKVCGFRPKAVARAYFKVRDKIKEIEAKVMSRDSGPIIDTLGCPF